MCGRRFVTWLAWRAYARQSFYNKCQNFVNARFHVEYRKGRCADIRMANAFRPCLILGFSVSLFLGAYVKRLNIQKFLPYVGVEATRIADAPKAPEFPNHPNSKGRGSFRRNIHGR